MTSKRPPLDEVVEAYTALVALPTRRTTANGNVGGTSLVDATLIGAGANSFFTMLIIIEPGNPLLVDSSDITVFNNATGEITFNTAYKGGQVLAGTPYKICPFRFVTAEVAALTALVTALMADVGDASAAALGSLYGILGNPAQNFNAMVGYEGATSLANKLTVARATFLDIAISSRAPSATALSTATWTAALAAALANYTAARAGYLDELAAANIPADIDGLKTSRNRQLFFTEFRSDLREEIAVTGAQSTIALPTITVAGLPAGAVVVIAYLDFWFRVVENTFAGVNKLDAAAALPMQVDDSVATGYVTAIDFIDDAFGFTAAGREGGTVVGGKNNIAARVDGNDVYSLRWLNAKADQNNLQFNDCQFRLKILYSV